MELNMKRNLIKTFFIFIIFTLFITSSVFASDININTLDSDDPTGTTTLEVVEENICNINPTAKPLCKRQSGTRNSNV